MEIRIAEVKDISRIMEIFDTAKEYMIKNGNPNQWHDGYPWIDIVEDDVQKNNCYVIINNEKIVGTFAFIYGDDPTYKIIKEGDWKNNEPYGTIHRIASDGTVPGIFHECIEFCSKSIKNIRIDTHELNSAMQYLCKKEGFEYCGKIYTEDGGERLAYQKIIE